MFAVVNPHKALEAPDDPDMDLKSPRVSTIMSSIGDQVVNFKEELYEEESMDFRLYIHNKKLFDNDKYESFK